MATTITEWKVTKHYTRDVLGNLILKEFEDDKQYFKQGILEDMEFFQRDNAYMQRLARDFPNLKPKINEIITHNWSIIYTLRELLND